MAPGDPSELYESCVTTLREMLDAGAGMHDIERAIDTLPVSGDERSALWLWATARRDRACFEDRAVVGAPARQRPPLSDRVVWPGGQRS